MDDYLPHLQAAFWLGTTTPIILAVALWTAVAAIRRARYRRDYHAWLGQTGQIWQGQAIRTGRPEKEF